MSTPPPTSSENRPRSDSRPRSRPTTPLRRSASRPRQVSDEAFPLNGLEHLFVELNESMCTLDANFHDLQVMHNSISRFNESFSGFLYGLNLNAYCVDFPEAPTAESFERVAKKEAEAGTPPLYSRPEGDYGYAETTFMTTDTSFVAEPPVPNPTTPAPPQKAPTRRVPAVRGGRGGAGRGAGRGGSGIARGRGSSISHR